MISKVNFSIGSLINLLKRPYPIYYTSKNYWKLYAITFPISFFFSFFFEPFEVNRSEHKMSYFMICVLHAFIPALITIAYFSLINYLTKNYKQWTVGKEVLHIAIVLLLIGVGSFLLRDTIYNNPDNWSSRYLFEEIRNTFLVGVLIIAIIVPINYNLLLKKHIQSVQKLKKKGSKPLLESVAKIIQTQVKADNFELFPDKLMAVRSDGNYSEFFISTEHGIIKLLKRISIKELEQQISDCPQLLKTHRGWLVNLNWVVKTTGNAGGYQLTLSDFSEKVPVSRSLIAQFNERMSSMSV